MSKLGSFEMVANKHDYSEECNSGAFVFKRRGMNSYELVNIAS
jgi:hypothetical protein